MTIIELLNKKANGERTPKKFKYDGLIFIENDIGIYLDGDGDELTKSINLDLSNLNDEIEIIEDKKIRKLKKGYSPSLEEAIFYEDVDNPIHCVIGDEGTELLINKINEIIDHINKGEDK